MDQFFDFKENAFTKTYIANRTASSKAENVNKYLKAQ